MNPKNNIIYANLSIIAINYLLYLDLKFINL